MIDNGSDDGTEEYIKNEFKNVILLRTENNLGYSGGFNFGMKYAFNDANADYVLITNNDVKADSKAISELVKAAETNNNYGFVTGKVYYYDKPGYLQTVGKMEHPIRWSGGHIGIGEKDVGQYEELCERYFADDIFTLVKKSLYFKIGGYDTNFKFEAEEFDWQARAKSSGFKIMYTPYAKIWHKESKTIGKESPFKAYYDSRNSMLVILKHKSPEFFRRYFWLHFRKDIFRASFVILKRFHFKTFFSIWKGFFAGLNWGFKNKKFSFKHFFSGAE